MSPRAAAAWRTFLTERQATDLAYADLRNPPGWCSRCGTADPRRCFVGCPRRDTRDVKGAA